MRSSRFPGLGSKLEGRLVTLFIAGTLAAVLAVTVAPLPAALGARIAVLAAILAVDIGAVTLGAAQLVRREHRQVSELLERDEMRVRDAERMASVGRVAAGIAHEVGNPLTGIANFTHLLRARVRESPDADAALDGIEREVDRIERIVSSLLDYARPQPLSPAAFDAGTTLRSAVQLLAAQGVFRRVQVQSTIEENPIALIGNPHELEQAFVNLLLNAIDAMEAHGTIALYAGRLPPDTILRAPRRSQDSPVEAYERKANPRLAEWRARRPADEQCAKFVIADSGTGVGRDHADRIFDPFFTTKSQNEGSGLGLAIVQRVVEAHQGVVWAQPAREGGAAFHVVLPLGAFQRRPQELS